MKNSHIISSSSNRVGKKIQNKGTNEGLDPRDALHLHLVNTLYPQDCGINKKSDLEVFSNSKFVAHRFRALINLLTFIVGGATAIWLGCFLLSESREVITSAIVNSQATYNLVLYSHVGFDILGSILAFAVPFCTIVALIMLWRWLKGMPTGI